MAGDARGSRRAVLVVMCVGYFLVLLDVTIVNVALPSIASDLGSDVGDLQWVVDGYAVALASLMLGFGTLGDLHGHRRVVLTGLLVFGAGSLGCGLSGGSSALIAMRVVQGVGAALLLPGTLAIISDAFPDPAERARAIGLWAGIGSIALPAGPLLGGLLVEHVGWQAVFLVNVPIVAVALPAASRVVGRDSGGREGSLDLAGMALAATALATTTFAFVEIGSDGFGVKLAVAAAVAVASAILFLRAERRARTPMVPLGPFTDREFVAANGIAGAMNLGTLGMLFVFTLYLQQVQGRSAVEAGVSLLPLFLPLALLAPLGGRLTARLGARRPMVAGLVLAAAGVGAIALAGTGATYLQLLPSLLLWGLGLAALTPAVVAAAIAAAPADRSGFASAMNNTARQVGGAIGIAGLGAVVGSAAGSSEFVEGMHVVALIVAALFLTAALAARRYIPTGPAAGRAA